MTGLLDIAPQRVTVDVLGRELEVEGVTVRGIAELLRRFPGLRELFAGGQGVESIAAAMPDLVAAIIASGLGYTGDAEYEAAAERLPAEAQAKLFGAILRLTMPAGIGPFVEELATAFGSAPVPPTTSTNGSRAPSKSSSHRASLAETCGP
jgi:hypothetical protein